MDIPSKEVIIHLSLIQDTLVKGDIELAKSINGEKLKKIGLKYSKELITAS